MKVLIADDSATSRELLRRALSHWGYEVVMAEDGNQAWEVMADVDPPPMAILDWVMPGMTGPEVCRKIRETHREPYPYIILLTSKNTKGETVEGLEAGADDYVVKPFDQHEQSGDQGKDRPRYLLQQRPRRVARCQQHGRERQPYVFVDLHLVDAFEVVFNRIFGSRNIIGHFV